MTGKPHSKIGILGGTFDPIHQGHLQLARTALRQHGLSKVLFVPAFIPPHKSERRDMTPAPYRYRMVETAVREEPLFEVSDVEFSRPDVSYTVDTLQALRKIYPGADFYLILGEDSLAAISGWKDPDVIVRDAKLLVARRPGARSANSPYPVNWIDMPVCPLSSSQIREAFGRGEHLPHEVVPQEVQDYIQKMNLYRKQVRPCT